MKVLLKRFHLNGHTIGFRPQTQKLESPLVNVPITDSRSERVKCSDEITLYWLMADLGDFPSFCHVPAES